MKLYNSSKNNIIANNLKIADSFLPRAFGLIPKNYLPKEEALILKPCSSIHTFFMRFPIDLLFVDKNHKIIKTYEKVKPWRVITPNAYFNSSHPKYAVELHSGIINAKGIEKGDIIAIKN